MKKIVLVTDDFCSLPEKIIDRCQIEIVKTKLYFPEWEKFLHPVRKGISNGARKNFIPVNERDKS